MTIKDSKKPNARIIKSLTDQVSYRPGLLQTKSFTDQVFYSSLDISRQLMTVAKEFIHLGIDKVCQNTFFDKRGKNVPICPGPNKNS